MLHSYQMEASVDQKIDDGTEGHHTPEKELACVVLHAGEMSDVTLLKDYLQVTMLFFIM